MRTPAPRLLALLMLAAVAGPASAHSAQGLGGGFAAGFLHPLLGWDHVAAMVAVGLVFVKGAL